MSISRLGEPRPALAILRALQLGDLLCAVPALRALRHALPRADIVLIGLPWARGFADRYRQYLDGFREFPGYPGLPEQTPRLERFASFLDRLQKERFDLVLQLHGSGTITNPLAVLFGARSTAGFYVPGQYCPDPDRFLPYPEDGLETDRLLGLLAFLGVARIGETSWSFRSGPRIIGRFWACPGPANSLRLLTSAYMSDPALPLDDGRWRASPGWPPGSPLADIPSC